ncbi:hypothetical protein CSKR_110689 [Clonorchis sinensis]|uniref:Uncharacterized protein n=1 Tax=Clonorchis sinensis TaxID=79923 RepID=A0A419Q9C3_CLOSI|nr:hypothetical protein CSKR_110689 [Clonorchis sinensis]
MRRPGAAHSVAWKHQKREIQLGSRLHGQMKHSISVKEITHKASENFSTAHQKFRPLWTLSGESAPPPAPPPPPTRPIRAAINRSLSGTSGSGSFKGCKVYWFCNAI